MCHCLCWCALFIIGMLGISSESAADPQFHGDSGGVTDVIDYRFDPMAWQTMWASPVQVPLKVVTYLTELSTDRRSDLADCQAWLVGWGANGDVLAAMPQLEGVSDTYRVTNSFLQNTLSNTTISNTPLANSTGSDTTASNQMSANDTAPKNAMSPDIVNRSIVAQSAAAHPRDPNLAIDLHRLMNQQVRQWRFVPRQTPARPALVRLWLAVDAATHRLQLCIKP